ncbi:MAG: bifunctional (p)ppGpp synthetase/guanosine-3',5'-bis(diphosphate) 3'-pyrophosphohydrolase [Cyanobacteria bacterium J06632_22]
MDATVSTLPQDCTLPTWLSACLLERCCEATAPVGPSASPHLRDTPALSPADTQLVCRAFEFAYQLHKGQRRASGDPYIDHPVAVAEILRELGGDSAMIAAGFLHDVVEDTDVTADEIESNFGPEVRQLVEGVTKLSKYNFHSKTERQAENFRRMFLAMAQDIRVIVVKLADRLHNMRTLQHLPAEKQRRIARETMDIFAPLANRLGIGHLKWELEDLSFKYLEPDAYREIQGQISEKRAARENRLKQIAETLRENLEETGIRCIEVSSRPKHLYSICRKMRRQQKDFHQIYDIAAIRLILNSKDECYRALAIVHDRFRPIPGRFKDYIGLPKANRYQSLHTTVIGNHGRPIEVQIRTLEMHQIAEYGIAAHWKYKESGSVTVSTDDEKFTWLRQLLEWQKDLEDAQEYLSDVKDNLFDEEVYVFTPKGDVLSLGRGATPVDFAYRIHTEVGNHCAGARVNGRMVTLDTELANGDIVEVLTQKNGHPSLDWLNFVVSAGARNRIRQWYKRCHHDENMARGREMLERVMGREGLEALLKSAPAQEVAQRCNYACVDDLLAALGYGEVTLNLVVNRLQETVKEQQPVEAETNAAISARVSEGKTQSVARGLNSRATTKDKGCPISGIEGLVHHIAGCCNPLPGEPIIGIVSLGSRGIAVHRQGCPNVESIPGDRLLPISWKSPEVTPGKPNTYPVVVKLEVIDRVGVLKDILGHLSDLKINVHLATVKTFPGQIAQIDLGLDVKDHAQLDHTFSQFRKMTDVLKVKRVTTVGG